MTAIIQYPRFKARVFDQRAMSDLRALIAAEENYYIDHEQYTDNPNDLLSLDLGNRARITIDSVQSDIWTAQVYHPEGSKTFCYRYGTDRGVLTLDGAGLDCSDEVIRQARQN